MTTKSKPTDVDTSETGGFAVWDDITPWLRPIEDAKPHPKNPRRGRLDVIEESMDEHGVYEAFLVQQSTGYIVFGAHRWQVMKNRGAKLAPLRFKDLTDEQAERIRLIDNRAAELGDFDVPTLVDILQGLGDLRGTGYVDLDLSDFQVSLELPGSDVDPEVAPRDHKPKFNTNVDSPDDMRIDKSRRILVLDVPVAQFAWIVDALAEVSDRFGVDSNCDAIVKLLEKELDVEAPTGGEGDDGEGTAGDE